VGSDRRALVEGEVSVSPLTAPALSVETGSLQQVVDGYNDSERAMERAH
jgi:5'-nucleotidase